MWAAEIRLNGIDVETLSRSFGKAQIDIKSIDNRVILSSDSFVDYDEPRDVFNGAIELVELINGSLRLVLRSPNIAVLGVVRVVKGSICNTTIFPDPGKIVVSTGFVALKITRNDGTESIVSPADPLQKIIPVALENKNVARVVSLMEKGELTWRKLYMIYEIISCDAKNDLHKWMPKTQVKKFKWTANSWDITGKHGRHGVQVREPPQTPMELADARRLIEEVAKEWILDKARSSA